MDFDTTGFNPKINHILSIGRIVMGQGNIGLCFADQQVINTVTKKEKLRR